MKKLLIAGNWKMNKTPQEAVSFVTNFQKWLRENLLAVEVIIAPSFLALREVIQGLDKSNGVRVYAQNCSSQHHGSFTGEVSAVMLKAGEVDGVIIGHSERRMLFNENNFVINEKVKMAVESGLKVILCVGESLEEKKAGKVEAVIKEQLLEGLAGIDDLKQINIAYEPIWAIGTGQTPVPAETEVIHSFIRKFLIERFNSATADQCHLLYGGSLNASNAKEFFMQPNIDGGLIGGASLKMEEFLSILETGNQI